jgi:hypothetical protein
MATIQKRGDSYKVIVACGLAADGKQIRKTTTFKPIPGLTERQAQKALDAFVLDFERKVKHCLQKPYVIITAAYM